MAEAPTKPESSTVPMVDFESDSGAEFVLASASELPVLEDDIQDILDNPEDYPDYFVSGDYQSKLGHTLAEEGAINILTKREDFRGRLAIIYTVATFSMFVLGFLVAILDSALTGSSLVQNLASILPLISGIFLGTLGFVLGYYFRQVESDDATKP